MSPQIIENKILGTKAAHYISVTKNVGALHHNTRKREEEGGEEGRKEGGCGTRNLTMWSIWPWEMKRKSWEMARWGHLPMSKAILSVGKITHVSCPPIDNPSTGYPSICKPFLPFDDESLDGSLLFSVHFLLPIVVFGCTCTPFIFPLMPV